MYDGRGDYVPSFEEQLLTASYLGAVILASPFIALWLGYNTGKEALDRHTTRTWLHEIRAGNPSPYPPRSK